MYNPHNINTHYSFLINNLYKDKFKLKLKNHLSKKTKTDCQNQLKSQQQAHEFEEYIPHSNFSKCRNIQII